MLPPTTPPLGEFDISQEELTFMSRENDVTALQQHGGASSPSEFLIFFPLVPYECLMK